MPAWVFDDSPIPDPAGRATRVLRFADLLRHPQSPAPGQALQLTRWQRRIVSRIYGPCNSDGSRAVRTVFLMLPRGNRKTALGAVLALAHAIGPEQRPAGQVILAASDRGQARIAFEEAREIIRAEPELMPRVRIRDTRSKIEHLKSRSVLEAISADGDKAHGRTPTFVLADEIHVWRGFDLYGALRTGLSKVPGALCVVITTMGAEEGSSPLFDEMLGHAERVAAGAVDDPSFLPILFRAPDELPWDSEEAWRAANPGLVEGGFPDLASLRDEARQAREIPRLRIEFERLHLNRRPKTGDAGGLFDMAAWDACAAKPDLEALAGAPAWGGLDLSRVYDLTALSWLVEGPDGPFLLSHGFIPESALRKRAAQTDLPWRRWEKDGWITVIPGDLIDDDVIARAIRDGCSRFTVKSIAFDPKFAGKLAAGLAADGIPMVQHPQRVAAMAPGYLAMQRGVIGGTLRHDGSPVMRWNLTRAAIGLTESALPFVQKKRSRDSVDLLVAGAMALAIADANPSTTSIYSTDARPDGLLFLN